MNEEKKKLAHFDFTVDEQDMSNIFEGIRRMIVDATEQICIEVEKNKTESTARISWYRSHIKYLKELMNKMHFTLIDDELPLEGSFEWAKEKLLSGEKLRLIFWTDELEDLYVFLDGDYVRYSDDKYPSSKIDDWWKDCCDITSMTFPSSINREIV